MLESLFNKDAGLQPFLKIFKNTYFEEHLRTVVSIDQRNSYFNCALNMSSPTQK